MDIENLKKIIELQQKTQEHDRNLQLKNFKYEKKEFFFLSHVREAGR